MSLVRLFLAALVVPSVAAAQPKPPAPKPPPGVENPEFRRWAKFEPGTAVTTEQVDTLGKTVTRMTTTTTLVGKDKDKLTLRQQTTHNVNGTVSNTPPITRDVPNATTLPPRMTAAEFAKPLPGAKEQGKETLKVGGVEYKCAIYRHTFSATGTNVDWKMWYSEEVPGGMVKMDNSGKGNVVSTSTFQLISVKKP